MIYALERVMLVLVIGVSVLALWQRRHTWQSYWERNVALSVALDLVAALLMTDMVGNPVDELLCRITGQCNLTDWLAATTLACATTSLASHIMKRLAPPGTQMRDMFRSLLGAPLVGGSGLMLGCLCYSATFDAPHGRKLSGQVGDEWAVAYQVTLAALSIYLCAIVIRLLLRVRADQRSRPVANLYLVAACGAVAVTALRVGTLCALISVDNATIMTLFYLCLSVTIVAAIWSFREKALWFKGTRLSLRPLPVR